MFNKPVIYLIIILLLPCLAAAQGVLPQGRFSTIEAIPSANGWQFRAQNPPLQQMAGAPTAFYEHYWEFGDGNYSFLDEPGHNYSDTGTYEVRLWATGNYDNGKPPTTRPKKVKATSVAGIDSPASNSSLLAADDTFVGMRANRSARPTEELALIISYKNPLPQLAAGSLHLFYNQNKHSNEHFVFLESRTHHGEQEETAALSGIYEKQQDYWASADSEMNILPAQIELPSIGGRDQTIALDEAQTDFRSTRSWRFSELEANTSRNLFVSLEATPEMLADTNATIQIKAVLVFDDHWEAQEFDLELEIVASHDPNHISVSDRRANFRKINSKTLDYKARFQNNGEGPASTVEVTCSVPKSMQVASLVILDQYPECPICPKTEVSYSCLDTVKQEEALVFTYRNIYLPGSNQAGVKDRDSTKGFVKYRLQLDKRVPKRPFSSRAKIVFDKNEPIYTNRTTTRFKPGISPGIKFGWNTVPGSTNENYYYVGAILSPFKSYRFYYQAEISTGFSGQNDASQLILGDTIHKEEQKGDLFIVTDSVANIQQNTQSSFVSFDIIPLSIRKNLTGFLGIGAGAQLSIQRSEKKILETVMPMRQQCLLTPGINCRPIPDNNPPAPYDLPQRTMRETTFDVGFFADVKIGPRAGPAVGGRAMWWPGRDEKVAYQLYALFQF